MKRIRIRRMRVKFYHVRERPCRNTPKPVKRKYEVAYTSSGGGITQAANIRLLDGHALARVQC
jgi:hypothetical protein